MKHFLKIFSVICLIGLFLGCESGDDGDDDNANANSLIRLECAVESISTFPIVEGDVGFYDCGTYRIIVTEQTRIIHTRDSCSGLFDAGFSDVKWDDVLFVDYRIKDADFTSSPINVRATQINGYRPQCLYSTNSILADQDCDPCRDKFFD